jgi:hypothetical protein
MITIYGAKAADHVDSFMLERRRLRVRRIDGADKRKAGTMPGLCCAFARKAR